MRLHQKNPLVLLLRGSMCELSKRECAGVLRYAHDAGLTVQTVEFSVAADARYRAEERTELDIGELLQFWKPAGCIVECSGRTPRFPKCLFGRTPVVYLDCAPELLGDNAVGVTVDSADIAKVAARELLGGGFAHYAYVPWPDETVWSRERGTAFSRILKANGHSCSVFSGNSLAADALTHEEELAKWLDALPKPCGLFAANDFIAERVLQACQLRGIDVPRAVSVVGVDDDEQFCENAPVSLSSVRPDTEGLGFLAAALLDRQIRHLRGKAIPTTSAGAVLVRRQSSRHFIQGDGRVIRALEFIRRKACDGIRRRDVVAFMGCSPRLADMRFRETMGHSILDEIHAVRLERVQMRLRECHSLRDFDPMLFGYASREDFRRVFHRYIGVSPGKWLAGLLKLS